MALMGRAKYERVSSRGRGATSLEGREGWEREAYGLVAVNHLRVVWRRGHLSTEFTYEFMYVYISIYSCICTYIQDVPTLIIYKVRYLYIST